MASSAQRHFRSVSTSLGPRHSRICPHWFQHHETPLPTAAFSDSLLISGGVDGDPGEIS